LAALSVTLSFSAAAVSSAGAVEYEPEPPFCAKEAVHDFLRPLARMPKLSAPPANRRLPFARGLQLRSLSPLVVEEGRLGYSLSLAGKGSRRLDWDLTVTLSRVDARGRPLERVGRIRRHVGTIRDGVNATFRLGGRPAFYRVTIVFRGPGGRKIGSFGYYGRVVQPVDRARLRLDEPSYRLGETVFGRVENLGTNLASYGARYEIQRLEGTAWVTAPESPRIFILPLYASAPGMSGDCSGFWIPPSMAAPGRYRMVKDVMHRSDFLRRGEEKTLMAEFDLEV
jgi:hypothetical protein